MAEPVENLERKQAIVQSVDIVAEIVERVWVEKAKNVQKMAGVVGNLEIKAGKVGSAEMMAVVVENVGIMAVVVEICLLYTSDAADDMQCVDLGGRRIIKKVYTTRTAN